MLFTSLRMILIAAVLACLMTSDTCVAGGFSSYFAHETRSHQPHERQHRMMHPAPRATVVESAVIRRVARPQEENAPRPESGDQNLEDRVTKLEQNFTQLNQEVSRLADLLQRQINLLDKTQ